MQRLVVFCRMLRSYGNVIILYADECYAIKPEVNYLMSKVECQVSLHTLSIPRSLFLTKNILNEFSYFCNIFLTLSFCSSQSKKKTLQLFIIQYHRNNTGSFLLYDFLWIEFGFWKIFYKNGRTDIVFCNVVSCGRIEPVTFWTVIRMRCIPLSQLKAASF